MPSIGWLEILIIVSIAIIVVGPKDFPYMLKKIGSWIGTAKRYVRDVQGQVSDLTNKNKDDVFVFNGWMFSSSPSITPFDHPVYDIWLVSCY